HAVGPEQLREPAIVITVSSVDECGVRGRGQRLQPGQEHMNGERRATTNANEPVHSTTIDVHSIWQPESRPLLGPSPPRIARLVPDEERNEADHKQHKDAK